MLTGMGSPLDVMPNMSSLLGRFVANWSLTETHFFSHLRNLLGCHSDTARAVWNALPGDISRKIDLTIKLCDIDDAPLAYRAELKSIMEEAKDCAALRNKLVHGAFGGLDDDAEVACIVDFRAMVKGIDKPFEQITLEDMERHVNRVAMLNRRLFDLSFFPAKVVESDG